MKRINKITQIVVSAGVLIGGFAFVALAHSEDEIAQETRGAVLQEQRMEVKDVRQGARKEAGDIRQETRTDAKNLRQEVRTEAKGVRQEVRAGTKSVSDAREVIEVKREELKRAFETKREEAKRKIEMVRGEAKERIANAREELQKKLEILKDERKKATAVRLEEQLNRLNERWTSHFANALDRLDEILGKIQLRREKAVSLGKDVSVAESAIAAARTAIANARVAVQAQVGKVYTVTFASEEELRIAFQQAKEQLKKDLTAVRDGVVKAARDAVHQAARALAGIPKVDEEPEEATTTPAAETSSGQ
ncbi:MAG: hypothetical protein HYW90_00520 [Candidatus Sungbacteria bacterium]|nr:hypothetical protein [Candidatus Sungbacteria bacterium]